MQAGAQTTPTSAPTAEEALAHSLPVVKGHHPQLVVQQRVVGADGCCIVQELPMPNNMEAVW